MPAQGFTDTADARPDQDPGNSGDNPSFALRDDCLIPANFEALASFNLIRGHTHPSNILRLLDAQGHDSSPLKLLAVTEPQGSDLFATAVTRRHQAAPDIEMVFRRTHLFTLQ